MKNYMRADKVEPGLLAQPFRPFLSPQQGSAEYGAGASGLCSTFAHGDIAGHSANNLANHVPLDVGEPHVAAGVAISQLLVVQAEQVQDRGVPVVDMDLALDGLVTVIVRGPVGEAGLHAT